MLCEGDRIVVEVDARSVPVLLDLEHLHHLGRQVQGERRRVAHELAPVCRDLRIWIRKRPEASIRRTLHGQQVHGNQRRPDECRQERDRRSLGPHPRGLSRCDATTCPNLFLTTLHSEWSALTTPSK